jgi:NAD(P)-dependent dehydrogenase (short-subunit alcohol dehydrogenase family)
MADWRRIIEVDLVGTALLVRALEPLTSPGSAAVCWASIAGHGVAPDEALDAALDDPLAPDLLDRLGSIAGDGLGAAGQGYGYAKRGVMRLVAREAVAWGTRGARICSISPGIIDTPQGRQESTTAGDGNDDQHPIAVDSRRDLQRRRPSRGASNG